MADILSRLEEFSMASIVSFSEHSKKIKNGES